MARCSSRMSTWCWLSRYASPSRPASTDHDWSAGAQDGPGFKRPTRKVGISCVNVGRLSKKPSQCLLGGCRYVWGADLVLLWSVGLDGSRAGKTKACLHLDILQHQGGFHLHFSREVRKFQIGIMADSKEATSWLNLHVHDEARAVIVVGRACHEATCRRMCRRMRRL